MHFQRFSPVCRFLTGCQCPLQLVFLHIAFTVLGRNLFKSAVLNICFMREDFNFEDVERLLDSDLDEFEGEVGQLYEDMKRFAETASVLYGAERPDDAQYFEELAVDRYESFYLAVQLKKEIEDEDGIDYDE